MDIANAPLSSLVDPSLLRTDALIKGARHGIDDHVEIKYLCIGDV